MFVQTYFMNYKIVIVGGGNAGISVASQFLRKNRKLKIAVIDPANKHYYQPAWTLVGGGVFDINKTERTEAEVMPKGVNWIKQKVVAFTPAQNSVELSSFLSLTKLTGRIRGQSLLVSARKIKTRNNGQILI